VSKTSLITWNVNGIRAVCRHDFLTTIKKLDPDILCLQEIKADRHKIPQEVFDLKSYHFHFNPASKSGYAGTALLSKIKPIKIIDKIGLKKFDDEGRFLLAEFGSFAVFNAYFPHSQRAVARLDFKLEFNRAYLSFIKKLGLKKPLILTGDFNVAHQEIDLANPKENTNNAGFTEKERKFMDELLAQGYADVWRDQYPKKKQYTWWTYRFKARERNVGWRIDYWLVPKKMTGRVKRVEILDQVMGSDHCPVRIEIEN